MASNGSTQVLKRLPPSYFGIALNGNVLTVPTCDSLRPIIKDALAAPGLSFEPELARAIIDEQLSDNKALQFLVLLFRVSLLGGVEQYPESLLCSVVQHCALLHLPYVKSANTTTYVRYATPSLARSLSLAPSLAPRLTISFRWHTHRNYHSFGEWVLESAWPYLNDDHRFGLELMMVHRNMQWLSRRFESFYANLPPTPHNIDLMFEHAFRPSRSKVVFRRVAAEAPTDPRMPELFEYYLALEWHRPPSFSHLPCDGLSSPDCAIAALPVELLRLIFRHLEPAELSAGPMLACHAWRSVIRHDDEYWRHAIVQRAPNQRAAEYATNPREFYMLSQRKATYRRAALEFLSRSDDPAFAPPLLRNLLLLQQEKLHQESWCTYLLAAEDRTPGLVAPFIEFMRSPEHAPGTFSSAFHRLQTMLVRERKQPPTATQYQLVHTITFECLSVEHLRLDVLRYLVQHDGVSSSVSLLETFERSLPEIAARLPMSVALHEWLSPLAEREPARVAAILAPLGSKDWIRLGVIKLIQRTNLAALLVDSLQSRFTLSEPLLFSDIAIVRTSLTHNLPTYWPHSHAKRYLMQTLRSLNREDINQWLAEHTSGPNMPYHVLLLRSLPHDRIMTLAELQDYLVSDKNRIFSS